MWPLVHNIAIQKDLSVQLQVQQLIKKATKM